MFGVEAMRGMNMRIQSVSGGVGVGLGIVLMSTFVEGADRPNILFILADDQGQHQISRYGDSFYETPNSEPVGG